MAIGIAEKKKFIDGVVQDLTKDIPNPTPETIQGMQDYATNLCNRIVTLIQDASITNADGSTTTFRLQ